jgi:MinD superfamily P-loop ATPase
MVLDLRTYTSYYAPLRSRAIRHLVFSASAVKELFGRRALCQSAVEVCPRRCLEGKKKPASKWMEPPSCNGWGFCARLPIVSAVRTDLRKIGWLCHCVWSSRLAVCIGMTASNASSRWHLGGRNCRKP